MNKNNIFKRPIINDDGKPNWKTLIFKAILFILFIFIIYFLLHYFFKPYMDSFVKKVSDSKPIFVILFIWIVDTFIVPASVDVLFPLLNWPWYKITFIFGLTSAFAGVCGYFLGDAIGHLKFMKRIMSSFSKEGTLLINRYGAWAVVAAALTPIPFSTVVWLSGILKVPFRKVVIACFARIPRMALYFLILNKGLNILI